MKSLYFTDQVCQEIIDWHKSILGNNIDERQCIQEAENCIQAHEITDQQSISIQIRDKKNVLHTSTFKITPAYDEEQSE